MQEAPAPSAAEGGRAPESRRADLLALLALGVALAVQLAPLLAGPYHRTILGTDSYRSHDWLEVAKFDHYARLAWLEWGTPPWWNPLLAGGLPQAAHPSDGSLSPLILPSLLLGEAGGMKWNVVLVAVLGALGVFFLARRSLRLPPAAALAAAGTYAWAGWLPARVAVGFYESCLMAAWPAVLALWLLPGERRAVRRRWVAGAVLFWILAVQLQLAVPVFVVLVAVLFVAIGAQAAAEAEGGAARRLRAVPWELAAGALAILALAGLLGGVKFVPMLDLLQAGGFRKVAVYPDHPDAWYLDWDHFWFALFHQVPNVPITDADGNPRVQEYMTLRPGGASVLLAAVGAASALRRRSPALPWLVVTAVFFWLSFGPHAWVDGFEQLRRLPLFGSMRGPLRYFNYPLLLGICLLAGVGFSAVAARSAELWPRGAKAVPALGVALLAAFNAGAAADGRSLYRTSFLYAAPEAVAPPEPTSEGLKGISTGGAHQLNLRKYTNVRRGVSTIYVPEDLPLYGERTSSPLTPAGWVRGDGSVERAVDYFGEAWVVDAAGRAAEDGAARLLARQGPRLEVEHRLAAPGFVVLNQNALPGWTCGDGPARPVPGFELHLGFAADAGPGRTVCTYRPPALTRGLAASALGVLGLLALWPWGLRGAGRRL